MHAASPIRRKCATSFSSGPRGRARPPSSRPFSPTRPRSPARAPSPTAPRCATTIPPRCASSGRSRWPSPPSSTTQHKINLIDTPGYGDFVGELRAGLRAADAALFVIPATEGREGPIDPATVAQWEECAAVGMPRAVVVARCDHARADQEATIAACQESFGAGVAPLYLPHPRRRVDDRPVRPALARPPRAQAPARRRGRPRRAHRGDHRAVRGRDAHGALPRAARTSSSPR